MPFHPELHHRRSIRLPGWDYSSAGAYFVTLVTHGRELLFGEIQDGQMQLSPAGQICAEEWLRSAELRSEVALDAWVVMPNHLHGVVLIQGRPGATAGRPYNASAVEPGPRPQSLSALVAGFKAAVTRRLNDLHGVPGAVVWQRSYHERIVCNPSELHAIREYIRGNPARWAEDRENPTARSRHLRT